MRIERDEQAGITLRGSIITYVVFILVGLGLCGKFLLDTPPRYPIAMVLIVCAVYMLVHLLRFFRLYSLWKGAFVEMRDDRVRGFGGDEKLGHGAAFDIPAGDVKRAELTTVPMSKNTALNALKLTAWNRTYVIVGLIVDEYTRRALQLNRD